MFNWDIKKSFILLLCIKNISIFKQTTTLLLQLFKENEWFFLNGFLFMADFPMSIKEYFHSNISESFLFVFYSISFKSVFYAINCKSNMHFSSNYINIKTNYISNVVYIK